MAPPGQPPGTDHGIGAACVDLDGAGNGVDVVADDETAGGGADGVADDEYAVLQLDAVRLGVQAAAGMVPNDLDYVPDIAYTANTDEVDYT